MTDSLEKKLKLIVAEINTVPIQFREEYVTKLKSLFKEEMLLIIGEDKEEKLKHELTMPEGFPNPLYKGYNIAKEEIRQKLEEKLKGGE